MGEEKDVGHSWLQEQITGSARGTFSHARCRGESDFSQLAWQLILVHPTWLFLQRTVVVRWRNTLFLRFCGKIIFMWLVIWCSNLKYVIFLFCVCLLFLFILFSFFIFKSFLASHPHSIYLRTQEQWAHQLETEHQPCKSHMRGLHSPPDKTRFRGRVERTQQSGVHRQGPGW